MKIPETSANIGAYYGSEENGQWQPNGVMMDSGVGGGMVGSGDAGVHRPPVYPVHMPRGHIPGYVMAGAYYPPAPYASVPVPQDDFADYMWMENEEEFDKQVMQQLEEEALMEQCIEAMLEDEQRERHRPVTNGHTHYSMTSNGVNAMSLEEAVSRSTLNPLAAEFVPTFSRTTPSTIDERQEMAAPPTTDAPPTDCPPQQTAMDEDRTSSESPPLLDEAAESKEESRQDIAHTSKEQTPEVSASAVTQVPDSRVEGEVVATSGEDKTSEVPKPQRSTLQTDRIAKTESKVQKRSKTEAKSGKSETANEARAPEKSSPIEQAKPKSPAVEAPTPAVPKPINYAAAAKLNKPKTASAPVPPAPKPAEKKERTPSSSASKDKVKSDKASRKGSTK